MNAHIMPQVTLGNSDDDLMDCCSSRKLEGNLMHVSVARTTTDSMRGACSPVHNQVKVACEHQAEIHLRERPDFKSAMSCMLTTPTLTKLHLTNP